MTDKLDTDDAVRQGGTELVRRAFSESPVHITADEREQIQRWIAMVDSGAQVLRPTGAALAYERSLLGRLINNPMALDDAAPIVAEEHFADDAHRAAYRAILAVERAGRGVDETSLVEWLGRNEPSGADWFALLARLRTCDSKTSTADKALSVFGAWRNRKLGSICAGAFHRARVAGVHDGEQILSDVADELAGLELPNDAGAVDVGIGDAVTAVRVDVEERSKLKEDNRLPGMPTGWPRADNLLGGWVPGNMIVVKADTGFGKTAWALSAALKAAEACVRQWGIEAERDKARSVAVFSLEMEPQTIGLRTLANVASVDAQSLRLADVRGQESKILAGEQHTLPLNDAYRIFYRPGLSVGALERLVRRLQRRKNVPPLGLVVIDYLQLLTDPSNKNNREQEVAAISTALTTLAKRYGICIMALSQVNADGKARESRRIEQDADAVMRLEPVDPDAQPADNSYVYDVVLHKNRHGVTAMKGSWRMVFMKRLQRFVPMVLNQPAGELRRAREQWWNEGGERPRGGLDR